MNLKKMYNSFCYASEGIVYAINTQRNMKVHLAVAMVILLIEMYLSVNQFEALIIFLCIAVVMAAEIFNTAIEKVVDMLTTDYQPSAKAAKDLAAGAVLASVLIIIAVGVIILLPYFYAIFTGNWEKGEVEPTVFYPIQALFILFATYTFKAYWYIKKPINQPSALTGIFFYILTLLSILFNKSIYLLGIILLLYVIILVLKRLRWVSIVQNGVISIGVTYLLYWLFY